MQYWTAGCLNNLITAKYAGGGAHLQSQLLFIEVHQPALNKTLETFAYDVENLQDRHIQTPKTKLRHVTAGVDVDVT